MTIKDKLLEPYYIQKDTQSGYLVADGSKERVSKGKIDRHIIGYYSSIESCLLKVVRLKTDNASDQYSLQKYINKLKSNTNQILNLLNDE